MKTQQPLLTVIVPCYNVEEYIDRCISSIVNQTYPNLEILLVDDGSTDETGARCDMWLEKDQRIRVLHKKNEGVSIARNTGIKKSTADYVAFVDADDCIDKNMYTDLMSALLSTHSDIVHCDYCIVYEDGRTTHRVQERDATIRIMGRTEGVIMILGDHRWRTNIWTKIYKKSLFDHLEFHQGRIYGEDMAIVHLLFHQASQTVFLDREYYFYFVRSGSISQKWDIQKEMKKLSDCCDAYHERYSFVNRHPEYHSALPYVRRFTRNMTMGLICNIITFPQYAGNDDYYDRIEQLRPIALAKGDKPGRLFKIEWRILNISPKCYKVLRITLIQIILLTNKIKLTNRKTIYHVDDLWGIFRFYKSK